jgi:hypothetical protein
MRRAAWGCLLTLLLLLLAGCSGLGPPQVPDQRLNETRGYDWNASANATYTLKGNDEYHAVLRIEGPRFVAYQEGGTGTRRPIRPRAVAFRYANGTITNGSAVDVRIKRRKTVFSVPNASGQLAYAAESRPQRFTTPVLVEGSHAVVLPPGRRAGVPIAGRVSPAPDNRTISRDQLTLRWADLNRGAISVRYYRPRDLGLFGALVGGVGLAALVAAWFVRRELRDLRARREAAGLEEPAADDDDSPPGFG